MRDYVVVAAQNAATAPAAFALQHNPALSNAPRPQTLPLAPRSARASLILFAALRTLGTGARLNPSRVVSANLSHSSF